jgi:L-asparaginase
MMKALARIHVIVTGGTIDSTLDGLHDEVMVCRDSFVLEYLRAVARISSEVSVEIMTLRDSRGITDNIRAEILESIKKTDANHILITHGTYTMPDTLDYLGAHWDSVGKEKVSILTGSMLPLRNFSPSDAPYNLGFALGAMVYAEPGIYLAMNGALFAPGEVRKDLTQGRFVLK